MRFAAQQPGIAQFLTSGPDYGGISDLGMEARSKERQTGYKAEANIRVNGLDAMARLKPLSMKLKVLLLEDKHKQQQLRLKDLAVCSVILRMAQLGLKNQVEKDRHLQLRII